jgi:putative serine protease PepD
MRRISLLSVLSLLLVSAAAVVAALVAVGVGRGGGSSASARSAVGPPPVPVLPGAQALTLQFERVVRAVQASVVQIETSQGLGSGIVFDTKGHIVTNAHVIGSAKKFTVTLYNGKRLQATLVGSFPPEDIGVIDVNQKGLQPAAWVRSSAVGEIVLAVGNPLGLRASVTQGIVSAVGRLGEEGGGIVLPNTIQTSAAINPGNSGGALVNLRGEVVGIPTLGAVNPQAGTPAAGIGFAISSSRALFIARQLIATGRVSNSGRAFLGVRVGQAPGAPGVVIAAVIAGSPAAKAGLHVGDAIVSVAGQQTPDPQTLASVLATKRPEQIVKMTTASPNGRRRSVSVTLAELPAGG